MPCASCSLLDATVAHRRRNFDLHIDKLISEYVQMLNRGQARLHSHAAAITNVACIVVYISCSACVVHGNASYLCRLFTCYVGTIWVTPCQDGYRKLDRGSHAPYAQCLIFSRSGRLNFSQIYYLPCTQCLGVLPAVRMAVQLQLRNTPTRKLFDVRQRLDQASASLESHS